MDNDIDQVIAEARRLRGAHLRHLLTGGMDRLTHAAVAAGHKLAGLFHHKGATA